MTQERGREGPVAAWSSRLDQSRRAGFAGRETELAMFEELLDAATPSRVLLIHGPGGVGKTSLLTAMGRLGRDAGLAVAELSAHELAAGPEAMQTALQARLGELPEDGGVLILDDFEVAAAWEGWLRDRILADLPDGVRVVIGGRWTPAMEWWSDPGWQGLAGIRQLGDFHPEETRAFLARHPAGVARAEEVHAFTRGHPLAVALAANLLEREPQASLDWEEQPGLVSWLVTRHLRTLGPEHHRAVLHAASLPPYVDGPLLQAMLPDSDPERDLAYLRGLCFTREHSRGLGLHELVSEALRAEMKRLEPDRHTAFIRRASQELARRMGQGQSEEAVRAYVYLMRDLPTVRNALPTGQETGRFIAPAEAGDLSALRELVEYFEGPESRRWFEFWAARQMDRMAVLRDPDLTPVGLSFFVDPFREDEATVREDPAAAAFLDYLPEFAPLRPGDRALLCRYILAADSRLGQTGAATQLRAYNTFYTMTQSGLGFSAAVVPSDQSLDGLYRLLNFPPLPGTEFRLGGQEYLLMGHDWRREPPHDWVVNTTERLLTGEPGPEARPRAVGRMSRTAVQEAVRDGLRALASGNGLADNPLAAAPWVNRRTEEGGYAGPEAALADLLGRGIEELEGEAETTEAGRLLRVTFLKEVPKQQAAAAMLGLSYGTYRRRRRAAIARLADWVWEKAWSPEEPVPAEERMTGVGGNAS